MSTNIQIDVVLQRLQEQAAQVLGQNRQERQEREDFQQQSQQATQAEDQTGNTTRPAPQSLAAQRTAAAKEHSGVPDPYKKRRPAAQRNADALVPFVFSWRGELTPRPATELEILLTQNNGTPAIRPSKFTYTGGDHLVPQPFQIASSGSKVQLEQPERYSEWKTVGQISLNNLTVANWTLEGFWAEELVNPVYTDWPSSTSLLTAPGNYGTVGAMSHTATPTYLSVATDGTMFIVLKLPAETVTSQSAQLPQAGFTYPPGIVRSDLRPIWWGSPATSSPMFLSGLQQYVQAGEYTRYSNYSLSSASSAGVSQPMTSFAYKEPYIFLRVKNGVISSKTAYYNSDQSFNPYNLETNFNTFIANNSYADDPGRNLRSSYAGEVRLRGGKAHILRMRYEEVFDGETYVWYENFPFPSLTSFISGTGAQAKLQAGVTFEDHVYTLSSYSTDAELAAQLAAITTPVGEPVDPPYSVVSLNVSSGFVAAAARRISTSGADELTPLTFFAAMP